MKCDALGRVRTPRERREQIVDEFERSGVSGVEFARLIGVKYPTLANWVQQRRKARGSCPRLGSGAAGRPAKERAAVQWVEAVVAEAADTALAGGGLRLELPGGARLEIGDGRHVALAAALLRALAGEGGRC